MKYRYLICDVFTETSFGGNQLAVLPQASGLSKDEMQQIAREFNFSETSFVFPPEGGHTRHVRIFTPGHEVPFAGHPNVGTAFVLASTGEFGDIESSRTVTLRGRKRASSTMTDLRGATARSRRASSAAPQSLSFGKEIPAQLVASAALTVRGRHRDRDHQPQVASVGLSVS
jgi:trans-2,3-dihydro-3-hydroxyanthranilate isomerase